MSRLALTFATGTVAALHFGLLLPAVLLLSWTWLPIRPWARPLTVPMACAGLAGLLVVGGGGGTECSSLSSGAVHLHGRFVAPTRGTTPFAVEGRPACKELRVWTDQRVRAGERVEIRGQARGGRAGTVVLAQEVVAAPSDRGDLRWAAVRWRGRLVERIHDLFPERGALVTALILARREGLEPEVRDAFAATGTSHLLAISGFHVGVIAGIVLGALRALGVARTRALLAASVTTWGYVLFLGAPSAASRAATIITVSALAAVRERPQARWGALGTALLLLLGVAPAALEEPGFQLSFAGAAGLAAWARPLERRFRSLTPPAVPTALLSALAAGVAATAATLPVVAWHFERLSLVGIPVTLIASPFVAFALPGSLAAVAFSFVSQGAGKFLAGGVDTVLVGLNLVTTSMAALPWASVWVPRTWVSVAVAGAGFVLIAAHVGGVNGLRRRIAAGTAAAAFLILWPIAAGLGGSGRLEILTMDVGQGDAIALRSPRGRWILVDAGPPPSRSPGPVVATLRRRGVTHLAALVLTHPDLDHIGGAPDVLADLGAAVVMDPARATGKSGYIDVLEAALSHGIPWRPASAGAVIRLDGVELEVLHPGPHGGEVGVGSNDGSVVLKVRFGDFDALLTGDAPAEVERALVRSGALGSIEVLKVGHHGSSTSTDSLMLATARPRVALLSVGRRNRYGHPASDVMGRLARMGVEVHRTDLQGSIRLIARRDGSFDVAGERPGKPVR